jgi:hypothetical protein
VTQVGTPYRSASQATIKTSIVYITRKKKTKNAFSDVSNTEDVSAFFEFAINSRVSAQRSENQTPYITLTNGKSQVIEMRACFQLGSNPILLTFEPIFCPRK